MSAATIARRLDPLEARSDRGRCPTCYGHPVRELFQDPESGDTWRDSMPDEQCPGCGRPVKAVHVLVIREDAESRAALMP